VKKAITFAALASFALALLAALGVSQSREPSDFGAFYVAGRMVDDGHGAELYDAQRQRSLQQSLAPFDHWRPFHRLPFDALVYVPLALLPYHAAFLVWWVLSLTELGLVGLLLWPRIRRLSLGAKVALALGGAVTGESVLELGQDTILFVLLLVLAADALEDNRDEPAGTLLGLATIKFNFLFPLFTLLFARRRWRVLAGTALAGALLFAVSVAVSGPEFVRNYAGMLRYDAGMHRGIRMAAGLNWLGCL
jgi:hypothetical protein